MICNVEISPLLKEFELRKNPIIIRVNKFDEKSAKEFHDQISQAHNTGQKVIPVIIDSYGGETYSLMSMISDIKHSQLPVATIVAGKAMSCGSLLFSFGEEGMRFIDKGSHLMIHDVAKHTWGKVEEIKADAAQADKINKQLYAMMAKNCGKKDDYFLNLIHEKSHADWYLDAKEAKKHNLANHLRVPSFKVSVNVDIDFE